METPARSCFWRKSSTPALPSRHPTQAADATHKNYAHRAERDCTDPDSVLALPLNRLEHVLPFSTWSLAKLADYLVDDGVVGRTADTGTPR